LSATRLTTIFMSKETTRDVSATNLVMEKEHARVQMKVKITTKMMMIRTKTTSLKMTMMRTKTTTKRTREVTASKTTKKMIREATVSKTKMTRIREAIVNKMRMIKMTMTNKKVKVTKEMILETN